MSKEIKFKGIMTNQMFNSDDFKIYSFYVDQNTYKDVKKNKRGSVTVQGNIHDLDEQTEYEIVATEFQHAQYGYGYKVVSIRRDVPVGKYETYIFLQELLTENQAKELYREYPNIVNLVREHKENEVDLSKLKGIGDYTFKKIVEKIVNNFMLFDLVAEFHGSITLAMIRKLFEKYASVEKVKENLREFPYKCLCGISRVGFLTADKILLQLEKDNIIKFDFDLKTSKQRCLSCMMYELEQNESSGNTVMDIGKLRQVVMKHVPACANWFIECLKNEEFYYDKDKMWCSLKSTYDTEVYIADRIKEALKIKNVWNIDCGGYGNVDGFELSDEQQQILPMVCKNTISLLVGFAGSGKSTSMKSLITMLDNNDKSYYLFAPTGRSAKVLAEVTSKSASTIHRGLGFMPPSEWHFNETMPLDSDVVIVDECSMIDVFLFKHLLEAIDFRRTKLVMVFDNAQIPSVSAGNIVEDLLQSKLLPTSRLTKIYRYGEGGLMRIATDVRNCKSYLDTENMQKVTTFGKNHDYTFISSGATNVVSDIVNVYKTLLKQGNVVEDIQILTSYNVGDVGSIALNNKIQPIANKNYGSNDCMVVGEKDKTTFYKDDIVIQRKNNYHAILADADERETFIANGNVGKVVDVCSQSIIIDFDGEKVQYNKTEMSDVKLGYAISIHSSQGGGINIPILVTPQAHSFFLNSNLIYVGLTRTKKKLYHIGYAKTVNMACKKKENWNRDTWLQTLLKGA